MISPQGYKLGEEPTSKNPFWGKGEDSDVNRIYATATVDDGTGVPSVSTSKTVNGNDITFGFDFHNLKGNTGPAGATGATGATGPAGPAGPAGQGVPAGGTAGQVLTKKSGTDYDTEWKDPTGGGSSGRISFGGKGGYTFEPHLVEMLYKTYGEWSRTINESSSITYYTSNGDAVNDTINMNGTLTIHAGTNMETTFDYYIGGNNSISKDVNSESVELTPSDFTFTLNSGNTVEITSLSISNIGNSSMSSQDAIIHIYGKVLYETESLFFGTNINIGVLNLMGQPTQKTYFLEPKK